MTVRKPDLGLDARLTAIADEDYPRFSDAEMNRRRSLMIRAMDTAGIEHLVCFAAFFRGGPVQWLSDWLTTYEAVLVFSPVAPDSIFIQFFNHLPQARAIMPNADVRWAGPSTIATVIEDLMRRGAKDGRVGAAGMVPMHYHSALAAKFGNVVDMNRDYGRFRMIKSAEELDRYRISARLTDLSIAKLTAELRPGLDEGDIGYLIESAYLPWRASTVIHFIGSTSMHDPKVCVPRQHPSRRKLQRGDVVSCELSASFWEHWGQVLRTFTIGEPATPLYRRLHETADEAYDAIFSAAKAGRPAGELNVGRKVIERAGFTFYDDLVHGFGGGYFQPIIGSPIRGDEPLPDMVLDEGMTIVIQPNVITSDQTAGVQTGDMVLISAKGAERLHTAPPGLIQVDC